MKALESSRKSLETSRKHMDTHSKKALDATPEADTDEKAAYNGEIAAPTSFRESNVQSGMVLPFQQLTMTFHDVHYFVNCPPVMLSLACVSFEDTDRSVQGGPLAPSAAFCFSSIKTV